MSVFDLPIRLRISAVWLSLVAVGLLFPGTAAALTPASPEVQVAVAKAQEYLAGAKYHARAGATEKVGGEALIALALYKSSVALKTPPVGPDHARIKAAISSVRAGIRSGQVGAKYESVYTAGLCIIFLSALKDPQYRGDIEAALKLLFQHQRQHGGFASRDRGAVNGDTSMTQYAVLGMWEAAHAGVPVPAPRWQRVTNWLMQTQLKDGGFTYNPPIGAATHSMTAAGAGCLYICANYVRKSNPNVLAKKKKKSDTGLPSALEPVRETKAKKEKQDVRLAAVSVDVDRLRNGLSRTDGWMANNPSHRRIKWPLYYAYALERYYAFREDWEKQYPKEPAWYTELATELIQNQAPDGSFSSPNVDRPIATAFAVLFLVRSTKLSLGGEETAGGTLQSGTGLPADLSQIRVKDGEVVVKPLAGPAGELLDIMADPDDPRFRQAVEGFSELVIEDDDIMVSKHLLAIQKLAKSGVPAARAKAVEALGKTRKLDHVPTFIYALADESPLVTRAARDALRFVSRKFDGFGFSHDAKPAERNKAMERWRNWYRTVRPEAEFED